MYENHNTQAMKILWVRETCGKFTSFFTNIDFNFHLDIPVCVIAVTTMQAFDTRFSTIRCGW